MMALFNGLIGTDGSVEREVVTVDPGIERWIPAYFQESDQPKDEVVPELAVELALPSTDTPPTDLSTEQMDISTPPSSLQVDSTNTITHQPSLSNLRLEKMDIQESPNEIHKTHSVIDPTGGGNSFLGGLSVGLARQKTILEATAWGSIAASFAIEQVGVPIVGVDGEGRETWNGVRVEDRLEEFVRRVGL